MSSKTTEGHQSFASFELDPRLLRAIEKNGFETPTLVQSKAIPLALKGHDLLVRARTGSGKTASYLIPIIEQILRKKESKSLTTGGILGLILVPTRELAQQVMKVLEKLTAFCSKNIRFTNLASNVSTAVQKPLLLDLPDLVIATPSRAVAHITAGNMSLNELLYLVIDEADLVFSFGYKDDIVTLTKSLPQGCQSFLMSATLNDNTDSLKGLVCRNPVTLKLEESEAEGQLTQYVVKCGEQEKFLLAYVLFKLSLIKGKILVFVNEIDRCYRLKLFLEQFGIKSLVLNSELPINTRMHIVDQFNKGLYQIIIAADEGERDDEGVEEQANTETEAQSSGESKKSKHGKKDKEYGVARGLDFEDVACVLNFDMPTTTKSYIHRVGRTARAGKPGISLSFVVPKNEVGKHRPTTLASCKKDERVLHRLEKKGIELAPYKFNKEQTQAFQYRMEDALRSVTRVAVQEARTAELKQEILASEKLKSYFSENPDDLVSLTHDTAASVRMARTQKHLKHVPDYLLPKGKQAVAAEVGFVPYTKQNGRKHVQRSRTRGKQRYDPLRTMRRK
ncbi:ATP-dependent RNA helicase Dbp9 [Schizosaccharomyces japonicus yFS275]|uniref:ATP-dependent RNA helicase DBP9 n=1 Tax=Schizosaccharomyces japonicus (strain yFS275 / FY16936) TaxID=402676 RepID=B6K7E1_SCHJY|nr:ATP-dependent RNA helicase Dbp9 [Schizosaccharomyces japonicus yFS275]EEB09445.1 ATP-dependent RNA helicase Dbp9 [Schizosaccharomyces japonicus yFS275]